MNQQPLTFSENVIKATARRRLAGSNLFKIVLRQASTEYLLRLKKKVNFRSRENLRAVQAYSAMETKEFEGINARQQWANWRTVPRNLSGMLPSQPVRAIDLCCGIGHSTDVLAHYLPKGSEILGLEYNPEFVSIAKKRKFVDAHGRTVKVQFRAQSVLETFHDQEGRTVPDSSIDVINCCGAVACHFDAEATRRLGVEVSRVLKTGGITLIDSGPDGTDGRKLKAIFGQLGFRAVQSANSCLLDKTRQICFQKIGPAITQ